LTEWCNWASRGNDQETHVPNYYVVNESTEDTFESSGNLEDAVRVAREVARQGREGDPVSIIEVGGMAVRQFLRMADGSVVEQGIARRAAS
jgi:hypothetical protein